MCIDVHEGRLLLHSTQQLISSNLTDISLSDISVCDPDSLPASFKPLSIFNQDSLNSSQHLSLTNNPTISLHSPIPVSLSFPSTPFKPSFIDSQTSRSIFATNTDTSNPLVIPPDLPLYTDSDAHPIHLATTKKQCWQLRGY